MARTLFPGGRTCVTAAIFALFSFVPLAGTLAASSALAASFTVSSFEDVADADPGNGVCGANTSVGLRCTLRAAVQESLDLVDAQIVVPAGTYTLSVPGMGEDAAATGDLDLRGGVRVVGVGPGASIIDGGGVDRVFDIHEASTTDVLVEKLTIRGGQVPEGSDGGGIRVECDSSCMYTPLLDVSDVEITGNVADEGGGIYSIRADLDVYDSTIAGNDAIGTGGGAKVSAGVFRLEGTTVNGNTSGDHGGGLSIISISQGTELVNSTVSGNFSDSDGGGIYVSASGNTSLHNLTVTGNYADFDGDGAALDQGGGGIASFSSNTYWAGNTLIADNENGRGFDDDCKTEIRSLGYNLVGVATGCTFSNFTGNPSANDQVGVPDPGLGPLDDNGGPTLTHALLPGSPAIDEGNPDGCMDRAEDLLTIDQRGLDRTVDGDGNGNGSAICDVGAVEYVPEPSAMALCVSTLAALLGLRHRQRRS